MKNNNNNKTNLETALCLYTTTVFNHQQLLLLFTLGLLFFLLTNIVVFLSSNIKHFGRTVILNRWYKTKLHQNAINWTGLLRLYKITPLNQ